jgi:hypothetical protein
MYMNSEEGKRLRRQDESEKIRALRREETHYQRLWDAEAASLMDESILSY